MKKKLFLMGILSMALVFGLVLTGCPTDGDDNGGGGDDTGASSYTFEVSDNGNAYSITIRGVSITTDISDGRTGFTVKVDGAGQLDTFTDKVCTWDNH